MPAATDHPDAMLAFAGEIGDVIRADLGFYWDCPVWPDVVEDRAIALRQGITGDGSDPIAFSRDGEGMVPWRVVDSDDPWPLDEVA